VLGKKKLVNTLYRMYSTPMGRFMLFTKMLRATEKKYITVRLACLHGELGRVQHLLSRAYKFIAARFA